MQFAVVTKNLQPSTTYRVQVAAYTLKGDGTRSHPIYVKTPKQLPPSPRVTKMSLPDPTKAVVHLAWRPRTSGVRQYKVMYGKSLRQYDNLADEKTQIFPATTRKHTFGDLDAGVWYSFKVSAQTSNGWSAEDIQWILVPDGKPSGKPQNVRAITESATSIKVSWESPDPWECNGKIIKYTVRYLKVIYSMLEVVAKLDTSNFEVQNYSLRPGETGQHCLPNTIVCFCVISYGQSTHVAIRTRTMMFG